MSSPPSADALPTSTTAALPPPPSAAAALPPPPSAAASPPSCTAISSVLDLIARILTFICLMISVIVLGTNTATTFDADYLVEVKVTFSDFYAYRYMLSSMIIGIVYTLLQTGFSIFRVSTGNRLGGKAIYLLDFYGDKTVSYMLATGAAAGFGFTVDANRVEGNDSATTDFLNKANAAASLLLLGFLFSAVSSVISSLSLPKNG